MFKSIFGLLIVTFLTVGSAIAADRAEFDLIGYSPDGRYFAFEEYGIQDGSGFSYSAIFILDVANDQWVGGAPHRFVADEENVPISAARMAARDMAQSAFEDFDISQPARLLALTGDGELEPDALVMEFGMPGFEGPSAFLPTHALSMGIYPAPSGSACEDYMGEPANGLKLILTYDGVAKTLMEDERIPTSRGCPKTYRPTAIVVPFGAYDFAHGVAIISVWKFGFEGLDRRFIAVPLANGE